MMITHQQNKLKLNVKLNEQEDEFKSLSSKKDVIILDENKDIMFPEEITDEGISFPCSFYDCYDIYS